MALGSTPSARELDDCFQDLTSGQDTISFEAFYAWWRGNLANAVKSTRKYNSKHSDIGILFCQVISAPVPFARAQA